MKLFGKLLININELETCEENECKKKIKDNPNALFRAFDINDCSLKKCRKNITKNMQAIRNMIILFTKLPKTEKTNNQQIKNINKIIKLLDKFIVKNINEKLTSTELHNLYIKMKKNNIRIITY